MNLDYKLFAIINSIAGHNNILDMFMLGMAKYGVILYALILAFLWFKQGNANKKVALKAVTAALFALAINQAIGLFYFRPRPFVHHDVNMLIDKSPDPSFPSDHATGSAALTFSILGTNRLLGIFMTILTGILMISRVYVGTHYPFDVIGGAAIGYLGSMISSFLWSKIDNVADNIIKIYNKFIPAGM